MTELCLQPLLADPDDRNAEDSALMTDRTMLLQGLEEMLALSLRRMMTGAL